VFDETNMTEEQEIALPDKLFESDDISKEESSGENHTAGETLTIKYNGEEKSITLEEAKILAQKGMNYDHVVAERDTRYKRELDFLDRVAKSRGLTRAQYMEQQDARSEAANPETPSEAGGRERASRQIMRITESLKAAKPWHDLFKKYPDIERQEAFSTLSESVARGMSPIEAYQEKLIAEKENLLRLERSARAAAGKSVGSLGGDAAETHRDEFLEGFTMYD